MRLTVIEAAKRMGTTPRFLQAGLREGKFPFGTAVKFTRWSYYISRERLAAWLEGRDMKEGDHATGQV